MCVRVLMTAHTDMVLHMLERDSAKRHTAASALTSSAFPAYFSPLYSFLARFNSIPASGGPTARLSFALEHLPALVVRLPPEGQRVVMQSVTPFLSDPAAWNVAVNLLPTVAPLLHPDVSYIARTHARTHTKSHDHAHGRSQGKR